MHRASSEISPEPTVWFNPHELPAVGTCRETPFAHPRGVGGGCIQTPWLGVGCMERFLWGRKEHTIANCLGSGSSAPECLAVCNQTAPRLFATLLRFLSLG